jgi:O-antigen/teichoic acid export membrane protein
LWDSLFVATLASTVAAMLLMTFPELMFPNSSPSEFDRLLPLVVFAIAWTDVALAACAYRFDIATTVRARSIVEPWVISIMAWAFWYYSPRDGLILSYVSAMLAAFFTAVIPMWQSYGAPAGWRPNPGKLLRVARRNAPLAAADAIEWGTRRLDLAILGYFASPAIVGIYYIAQQVASLPQKLKTSFDPILGPVITRNLAEGKLTLIAAQISQVGFWIIPGEAVMGLVGPEFVGGTLALLFLLAAEVIAATAVVSEAALVYVARHRNLALSLITVAIQVGLSFALILWAESAGLDPLYDASAVAIALMLALGFASVAKSLLLSRLLGAPVNSWRWALAWAAGGAAIVGWAITQLPPAYEWAELLIGVPLILAGYGWLIWTRGFGPADRDLFRKTSAPTAETFG